MQKIDVILNKNEANSMSQLDYAQLRKSYDADGVIIIRNFLNSETVLELKARLESYVDERVPTIPAEHVVYEEGNRAIRNLWRLDFYDPYFDGFGRLPPLRALVQKLTDSEFELHFVEAFMKPTVEGSEVPMHQDVVLQGLSSPEYLAAWFPLDPVDNENGPLHFIPGSHKWGPLEHEPILNVGSRLVTRNADQLKSLPATVGIMEPGDVALFNGYTLHYSIPNSTDRPRRAIAVGMRGPGVLAEPEKKNWERAVNSLSVQDISNVRK